MLFKITKTSQEWAGDEICMVEREQASWLCQVLSYSVGSWGHQRVSKILEMWLAGHRWATWALLKRGWNQPKQRQVTWPKAIEGDQSQTKPQPLPRQPGAAAAERECWVGPALRCEKVIWSPLAVLTSLQWSSIFLQFRSKRPKT